MHRTSKSISWNLPGFALKDADEIIGDEISKARRTVPTMGPRASSPAVATSTKQRSSLSRVTVVSCCCGVKGNSRLGLADPPYTDWSWTDLDHRFNGPALLRLPDGRLLAGGRSKALGAQSAKTAIGWRTTEPAALHPLLWLPSQHETGYPGLYFHDDQVWASYYSSQSGKCAIYIAQLVDALPPKPARILQD